MFGAFEWMLAMRYLRARRQEGFISVIAWFSLVGIALIFSDLRAGMESSSTEPLQGEGRSGGVWGMAVIRGRTRTKGGGRRR